jgi:hypothetical protein
MQMHLQKHLARPLLTFVATSEYKDVFYCMVSKYAHSLWWVHNDFWLTKYKQCGKLRRKYIVQRLAVFRLHTQRLV